MLGILGSAAHAQQIAGPNDGSSATNVGGGAAWTNPLDAIGSDDMPAEVAPGGSPSAYLQVTGFFTPLDIPSAASIIGITVAIERSATANNLTMFVKDSSVKIVKGNVIGGTEHADTVTHWPTADTIATYGSSSDLWGQTWTASDVTSSTFGVAISVIDSTGLTAGGVDNIQITVDYSLCPATPRMGCRTAAKSVLVVKEKMDSTKDKLIYKWIKGAATTQMELQNPLGTTQYSICLYEGANVTSLNVAASSTLWKDVDSKGFKYKDSAGTASGVQNVLLKGGAGGKSKILVKGKGSNLPTLDPPFTLPVTVQVVNGDSGLCFDTVFSAAKKNVPGQFKGKTP
jgi:hypothetical protein